jgi:hypothetical protein
MYGMMTNVETAWFSIVTLPSVPGTPSDTATVGMQCLNHPENDPDYDHTQFPDSPSDTGCPQAIQDMRHVETTQQKLKLCPDSTLGALKHADEPRVRRPPTRGASSFVGFTCCAGNSDSPAVEMTIQSVDAALEEVRPYLIADGGNVTVAAVEKGVVMLQLEVRLVLDRPSN